MTGKIWSEEQVDILDAIQHGTENIIVRAVAGSGKTSLLVEAAEYVPAGSLFLAFNKKIVVELGARLPVHCPAKTFHALCLQFLKARLPKGLKVDGYKSLGLVTKLYPECEEAKWDIAQLVGLMKNAGCGVIEKLDAEYVEALRENYDITNENVSDGMLVEAAIGVLKRGAKDLAVVDFDDMLYMTLKFVVERGWMMDSYKVVFVDEAQDTNAVQLHLLENFAERVIAVGDDFQAIYGFRGASHNSMPLIQDVFAAKSYPMTISWRCPEKVAAIARETVPHFRARDDAPEGDVRWITEGELSDGYHPGNMFLCRMNYPLFKLAIDLLKRKIPFNMTGKFPKQLISFVKHFKQGTIGGLRSALDDWFKAKSEELTNRNKLGLLERETDKYESLKMLMKECSNTDELVQTLVKMTTCMTGVKLSTIHGAKGLESPVVVFVAPELIPSKYATTEEQLQQETNLKYVAETRTSGMLVYCPLDGKGN